MTQYFAYGSNCNPQVMASKGVAYTSRQRATLPGFRLLFNKRALRDSLPDKIGFANISPCEDGVVEGILYHLALDALPILDRTERYPEHYDRIRVVVEADSGSEACWAYQAQPAMTADRLVPSRNYLNHLLAGRDYLSQQYFDALDQSLTYQDQCACCGREGEVLFVKEENLLHMLCQPCREARLAWSNSLQRRLTVGQTSTVMTQLVLDGPGYSSIEELLREAVSRNLI